MRKEVSQFEKESNSLSTCVGIVLLVFILAERFDPSDTIEDELFAQDEAYLAEA